MTSLENVTESDCIIRISEVERRTGVPRSTIYRWIAQRAFPNSIKLGPRNAGWSLKKVNDWIAEKQASAFLGKEVQGEK